MKDINSIDKDIMPEKQQGVIFTRETQSGSDGQRRPEAWWAEHLAGELPVLNFPGYKNKQFTKTYQPASVYYTFPVHFAAIEWCAGKRQKLFTLLVAAVNVLLQKYTRQYDIVIGTRSDNMGMPAQDDEAAHLLLIRSQVNKNLNVKQWLQLQQKILINVFENRQHLNVASPEVTVLLKSYNSDQEPQAENICFTFYDEGALSLQITYNAGACEQQIMQNLPGHLHQLLNGMMADEQVLIKDLHYLTTHEKAELLTYTGTKTGAAGLPLAVVDQFRQQAIAKSGHTAVVAGDNQLSFRELNERSDQLAQYLVSRGVNKNDRVLLCFNNAMEQSVAGILGIMKARATYVPVDADLPQERLAWLIADTGASFVVTNHIDAAVFAGFSIHAIKMDEPIPLVDPVALEDTQPTDHAYIIYTSGTTGDPKGVMISHANLSDYFEGLHAKTGIGDNMTCGLMSTLATDLGNTVLFSALIYGNPLHLFSKDDLRNAEYLHNYFNEHIIDCIKIVPGYWKSLELNGRFVLPAKMIIFGGEELQAAIVQKIRSIQPDVRIINHYGPTETTIGKLLYEIGTGPLPSLIPIGKPFSDTYVYIVDEELSLCARGIWGELLIGGKGVFSGYLNKPSLTEEKCITNRFSGRQERLYRTGDLVRMNSEGYIEFASRLDSQVKIQGYRIEPAEIAAVIAKHPSIRHCFVHATENGQGVKLLVAYLVTQEHYSEEVLKEYLKNTLPAYMIPSFFVKVPALPMTSNGKIDRKQLPAISQLKAGAGFAAPENEIQHLIIGILKEIFNREHISINDNFFELGGDSIKSIQVVSRLRQRGYILHLKDIIRNPVIHGFAAQVKNSSAVKQKEDAFAGSFICSPIQLYFFENKTGDYNHYNQSVILYGKAIRDEYILKAFDELVKYHDTLRIRFKQEEAGLWKQYYSDAKPVYQFKTVNYTDETSFYDQVRWQGKGLHIEKGPLIRLCLFKGEEQDRLLIVIHHLLVDGVSFRILTEHLTDLYRKYLTNSAFSLKYKSHSLKEWQSKLLEYGGTEVLRKEAHYWEQVDKSEFDRLRLPDHGMKNTIAARNTVMLECEESHTNNLLTKCYRKYNTEINDILVTALYLSLHEVFGLKKVLINLEGHGREDIGYDLDVSGTLGWFTSIFPVYFHDITFEDPVASLLQIKEHLRAVPGKGMGYGVLKYLKKWPLNVQPELTFNYLGDFSPSLKNGQEHDPFSDIKFNYQDASLLTPCNDILNFTGIIEQQKLRIYINYNRFLFYDEQITILGSSYKKHLLRIIERILQD
jgi:amino acid adenylation domain-containing protein/non-ribosomal peptide synthase protein (TIGR01720 family)